MVVELLMHAPERVPDVAPLTADFLRLLADPTRRQIFLLLMRGETCNCELAAALDLPQNLVSHHIRKLREAGIVRERRDAHDARWIHYTVDAEQLATLWRDLDAAFHPSHVGTRVPVCGSTAGDGGGT